jgi:CBS domain containing-hemolysin-like protein
MEFIVILFLILLNGMFAMYEIALISSRRTRLEEKAEAGSKGAKMALGLLDNPQEFLSTIQMTSPLTSHRFPYSHRQQPSSPLRSSLSP